jgi:squalene-hopene/tetraprenyl-beta-curcumene cyclase
MLIASHFFVVAAFLLPQGRGNDQVKQLKSQIDRLILTVEKKGTKRVREAAQYICALIHSPRHYNLEDGPLLRKPLAVLLRGRGPSGLFGNEDQINEKIETTRWALEALKLLDTEPLVQKETREALMRAGGKKALKSPFNLPKLSSLDGKNTISLLLKSVATYSLLTQKKPRFSPKTHPFLPFQQKALDWLLNQQQQGMWFIPIGKNKVVPDPGTTSLCLAALASKPATQQSEREKKILKEGVAFLLKSQRPDGSFSPELPNYVTCAAVLALSAIPSKEAKKAIQKAKTFILAIQNIEKNGYRPSDRDYGSIGYGGDRRGDVSNTQMAVEALRLAGLSPKDEAIQKALIFLRRSQNLGGPGSWKTTRKTEDGRKVPVVAGNDGGSAYYPGVSSAGYNDNSDGSQSPRSYGSMTYALLKCYVLAGLPKNDLRLRSALAWCTQNFTLDVNPGAKPSLGKKANYQGLYYYYLTLARALSLAGIDKVADQNWRKLLSNKLKSLQKKEGFWVNDKNGRWWESNPTLCTAYALLALAQ